MSMHELFDALGVALEDERWSWGGVRESDKRVFLYVWQDSVREIDGKHYAWVSEVEGADESLGARERLRHIALIGAGYRPYIVKCRAEDRALPLPTKAINEMEILAGGALIQLDDGFWLELAGRVPARNLMPRKE